MSVGLSGASTRDPDLMMRLLVVSQYFWPENFRINEIVSEMVRAGHQVTVLTGRPNYPDGKIFDEYAKQPGAHTRYEGAEILRLPLRPRGSGSLQLVLNYWSFVFWGCTLGPWLVRGRKFDTIFVFEPSPITVALPAILLARLKRTRLVLWVLDLWPDTLKAIGVARSPTSLRWIGHLCRFVYRRCDLVLGQSKAFAEPIARWSSEPAKFRYFPNWVEEAFEDPAAAEPAPELSGHHARFKILFAGNLGEAQDLLTVLRAAAMVKRVRPDICWLLVGNGRAEFQIRQAIDEHDLADSVFLLGRFPLARMPSFFGSADALLVSLKAEPIFSMTIPGKVQSYLAAGKPILAMLDGEGAKVIEAARAGVTSPAGDAPALASATIRLASCGTTERAQMGLDGRAYALREFHRSTLMRQLEGWLSPEGEQPALATNVQQ